MTKIDIISGFLGAAFRFFGAGSGSGSASGSGERFLDSLDIRYALAAQQATDIRKLAARPPIVYILNIKEHTSHASTKTYIGPDTAQLRFLFLRFKLTTSIVYVYTFTKIFYGESFSTSRGKRAVLSRSRFRPGRGQIRFPAAKHRAAIAAATGRAVSTFINMQRGFIFTAFFEQSLPCCKNAVKRADVQPFGSFQLNIYVLK